MEVWPILLKRIGFDLFFVAIFRVTARTVWYCASVQSGGGSSVTPTPNVSTRFFISVVAAVQTGGGVGLSARGT